MADTVAARADGAASARHPQTRAGSGARAPELPTLVLQGLTRTIPAGGTIFSQEAPAWFVYQVASGMVRTVTPRSDGRRIVHGFHLAGEIFGLERGAQHHCSAEAICETRLVQCSRRRFEETTGHASAAREIRSWLLLDRDLTAERSACLMYGSAFEKLSYFLLDLAARSQADGPFELLMSRYDIADYLGLTSETVSRTFSVFRSRGLIATRGRQVTFLDDRIRRVGDATDHTPMNWHDARPPMAPVPASRDTRWSAMGDRSHG